MLKTIILIAALTPFIPAREGGGAVQMNDNPKRNALVVLEKKCNVCHSSQNPRKVFTWDNMERFAPKIYKQVFVKKRMPKGKLLRLTDEEKQALMNWLKNQVRTLPP